MLVTSSFENVNLILTNSLCCIGRYAVKVSKLLSIGDNCADSEVMKLKLMNDYFNAALCYDNTSVDINTIISFNTNASPFLSNSFFYMNKISTLGREYHVIINSTMYAFYGDGTSTILTILINRLNGLGVYISHTQVDTYLVDTIISTLVTFTLTCNVQSMILYYDSGTEAKPTQIGEIIQLGNCIPTDNCLTEVEFEIIMNKLMEACEICPCQLI